MTAKAYRRDKRRTRRRSYRRDDISRAVDAVVKSRNRHSENTPKTPRRARPVAVALAKQSPIPAAREPVRFDPLHSEIERIADFARLLNFVRQEAAQILDDSYCEDHLTRCIDRLNQEYELPQQEQYASRPIKSVH